MANLVSNWVELRRQARERMDRFEAKARERMGRIEANARQRVEALEAGARERLQRALELPTRGDLDEIRSRIEQLAVRLDELAVTRASRRPQAATGG